MLVLDLQPWDLAADDSEYDLHCLEAYRPGTGRDEYDGLAIRHLAYCDRKRSCRPCGRWIHLENASVLLHWKWIPWRNELLLSWANSEAIHDDAYLYAPMTCVHVLEMKYYQSDDDYHVSSAVVRPLPLRPYMSRPLKLMDLLDHSQTAFLQ